MKYKKNTKSKGLLGEKVAVSYLLKNNFKILEKNLREKNAEVDIVALKEGVFHFVEVKSDFCAGKEKGWFPEERIDINKIKRINKVACFYLERKGRQDYSWCIDVISVLFSPEGELLEIKMMENVVL